MADAAPSSPSRAAVLAVTLTLIGCAAAALVGDRWMTASILGEERASVLARLQPFGRALSLAIDQRSAVLVGMRALIEVRWNAPEFDRDFDAFTADVERTTPGIRTLQYVVNGVIQRTSPRGSNDQAVGLDLYRHPDPQVPRDLHQAEQSDGVVLSGPFDLAQGGRGLVARLAARDSAGRLLCVVAAVLDLGPLLAEAQIDAAPGLALVLVNESGRVLGGTAAVLTDRPAVVEVPLPDRRWQLAARPSGGWGSESKVRLFWFHARVLLLSVLLSAIAGLLAARQAGRRREREGRARHLDDERFARLYQLVPDGVVLTRLGDEALIEVNETFIAITGYAREELIGHTAVELNLWESPLDRARLQKTLEQPGGLRGESRRLRRKDGSLVEVDASFRVFDLQGESCLLGIVRDMTEARELQLKLLQAQKMEAIGTLAGGVAHDFNNIISVILSYAELATQDLPPESTVREDLAQISQASTRAAALVQQLLAFSRRQLLQPRPVDVSAQAKHTLQLLERVLPSHIKLATSLARELPPVLVDPGQLEQVLMNLAVNARDAMPGGGTLSIETGREGDSVLLSVSDTGKGIPLELQPRIFEPFFTTKAPGKGTGLGLATCYGIVKQAGGRIEVRSSEKGSTFRVLLPCMRNAAPRTTTPPSVPAPPRGTETVLLAEDEPQVRAATARILRSLGYEVLDAADGEEALALSRAHGGEIALLVSDVMMPGLRGPELSEQLRRERTAVRTLFISGYSDAAALESTLRDSAGWLAYLGKPFTLGQLAAAVRELIDRS